MKRYYRPEWGENWREHFAVDRVNGIPGHELKFENQKLVNYYLRVGYDQDGSWRIYKLRPDFHPADKVQVEDDITASVVLPRERLSGLDAEFTDPSVKLVLNCETLLFQRPDDAIHRGADKQAEADIASPGTFLSNYEPFHARSRRRRSSGHVAEFDKFTSPMQQLLEELCGARRRTRVRGFFGASADGGREAVEESALFAEAAGSGKSARNVSGGNRRAAGPREFPRTSPVHFPVNAVLAGRRNSPPDPEIGLPPLAVYNPIHYQELPELFMEFISSLTGKSPSTTGFGSEGALTKAPFNALWPVVDLNNALVSAILTGYAGFTTSAGYVGPQVRVDHDISMLVPEIWCRMRVHERDPKYMIAEGLLERIEDFEFAGRNDSGQPAGISDHTAFRRPFSGPAVRNARCGVHRRDAAAGEAEPGAVRRRRGCDRGSAAARGAELFRGRQRRRRLPAAEGAAAHHGARRIRRHGLGTIRASARCSTAKRCWRATGTRSACARSSSATSRCGSGILQRCRSSRRMAMAPSPQVFDVAERIQAARQQLARVSSPAYLSELRGTIGADPLTAQIPS